jgi:Lar family restriction alleviation protein
VSELKPCPFCGGEALMESMDAENGLPQYFVACRCCACEGPWEKSPAGASRLWNMRADGEAGK